MNYPKQPPDLNGKLYLTIDECAHALSSCRASVYEMLKRGELRAVRIAGRQRIPVAALLALGEKQEAA